MRLKRLELENFRGFERLEFDFPDEQVIALVGGNGAGKSSILRAVGIGLVREFAVHFGEVGRFRAESVRLLDSDIGDGARQAVVRLWPTRDSARESIRTIRRTGSSLELKDNTFNSVVAWYKQRFDRFPLVVLYDESRWVRLADANSLDARLQVETDPFHDMLSGSAGFDALLWWLRDREDLENEHRARQDADFRDPSLEAVRRAVSATTFGIEYRGVRRHPTLDVRVAKDDQEFSLNALSMGERLTVVLAADIARRAALVNPSDPDPTQAHGLVMIDEVELHLHPSWQRRVLPVLAAAFPNLQFLVTTHSPQVVASLPNEAVFLLHDFRISPAGATEGRDSNTLLAEIFGAPIRPPEWDAKLTELARLIDREDFDAARAKLAELSSRWGANDPEVSGARATIELLDAAR